MTEPASPWISTPVTAALLHGWVELEQTPHGIVPHRLPARARRQAADPQLLMAEEQPSGVRICFRTEATVVELEALPTKRVYAGMPPRPDGTYDLVVDGALTAQGSIPGGTVVRIDLAAWTATGRPAAATEAGAPGTVRFAGLPAGAKEVEIWLPHDEATALVALRSDAPLAPSSAARGKRWLHHGSSISHGSNAVHPTGTWPAVAARRAGADLLNLGFGGSALLDPFVARAIRDQPADLISLKLGINLVNMDAMRLRVFGPAVHGFLDTIRDGHAQTPLLIVAPILCPIHEHTPGPSVPDVSTGRLQFRAGGAAQDTAGGKLTLTVIRDVLAALVAQRRQDDPNLHYLDGRTLYGDADHARLPLPDGLHPDGAAHALIGERFAAAAFGTGKPFG